MSWVFDHAPQDTKPSEMLVLLVLADHANEDGGLSYPSVRTLVRKTRLGERTVQAALKSLCDKGIIRVQMVANGPRPDVYCFPPFRGAEYAGVNNGLTPAENNSLPPQIFPKNRATPIKENRPIEPSLDMPLSGRNEYPADFEDFWKAYGPTNGPKKAAYTVWQKMSAANKTLALANLPAWLESDQWQRGYKIYPQKYLNSGLFKQTPVVTQIPVHKNGHKQGGMSPREILAAADRLERQHHGS